MIPLLRSTEERGQKPKEPPLSWWWFQFCEALFLPLLYSVESPAGRHSCGGGHRPDTLSLGPSAADVQTRTEICFFDIERSVFLLAMSVVGISQWLSQNIGDRFTFGLSSLDCSGSSQWLFTEKVTVYWTTLPWWQYIVHRNSVFLSSLVAVVHKNRGFLSSLMAVLHKNCLSLLLSGSSKCHHRHSDFSVNVSCPLIGVVAVVPRPASKLTVDGGQRGGLGWLRTERRVGLTEDRARGDGRISRPRW